MAIDAEALIIRLEATSEQLRREMRRAEREVGNSSKRMEREIRRVDQSMDRLNKTAAALRRGLGALGIGLSVQALRNFATASLDAASALANTADRVGLSTQALQQFRFAANQVGIASNTLDMAMQRLTRRFGEAAQGKGVLVDILEEFNIATHDANGRVRASEDVMLDLADAIASVGSQAERLRIAFKAFDSEGAALVNIMRDGSEGLRRYMREAQEFGMVLSDDLLRAADAVNTQLSNLGQTIKTQVQEGFLRTLTGDFGDLSELAKDQTFHQGLQAIGSGIAFVGRAVTGAIGQLGNFVQLLRDPSWVNLGKLLSGSALGLAAGAAEQFLGGDKGVARAQQLATLSERIAETRETIAALERSSIPNAEIRLEQERETLRALEKQRNEILGALDGSAEALGVVAVTLDTIRVTADDIETSTSSTASNVAEISEHENAILAALESATAAREQHAEDVARTLADLERQVELGEIELQYLGDQTGELEVQRRLYEIRNRLGERAARQAEPYLRQLQRQTQEIRAQEEAQRRFTQVVDDTVRYGSDLFADLFRNTSGGWRDMWENMRQTMISMLARMAAEAALRPIVVSVLGAMGVAGAGAAAGAAGIGGGGGVLGTLLGMGQQAASLGGGGMFSSGIFAEGGALAGVGSFMSKPLFMVPTGAIEAGTGAMAMAPGISLGGVLGAAGLGFMGGGMLAQLTGGNQMGGSLGGAGGAALGAAIGSAIPGIGTVLGGIAGGLIGGGLGSLLGGGNKDQEIRPISYAPSSGRGRQTPLRGIELDTTRYKGGGAFKDAVQQADEAIAQYLSDRMIQQVRDFLDERGTIRGKKRDNKAIGEKHIRRALREMYYPVIQALGGPEASRAFSSMTSSAKPEQVLETAVEVAAFLGQLHDKTLFKPQEISQLEAAWKELNARIEAAKDMAERLGQSLEEVARQGEEARQTFHDEIQQGYQDQIDALLRPAELAWRQLREAQAKELEELEKIGASTEKARQLHALQTRALFEQNYELQRQYLEGLIDLSEDLNAQVGALWGVVSTGIGGLIQGANAAYQEAVRLGRQYAQINRNLQQTIAGLRTGPQSPLSLEQQLMEALDRFRQTLAEALGGDSEAAQRLQQLVNPVLDLASQFFGRTEGYAQIFDEVVRGLEMAGVAMETQAGGFAALASALEAQIDILNEINDVLNRRDELGEDFESRYNKLTSELEEVGYTIGGINAFLRDAADAIPTTIVTAFASGLDSAQLAKRMGELFQATVTATEQAMRDGVEDIGAAIHGAQQALLRGWIPDFIELAEQFNGAIPELRFDRVTARVVAHYEASADQLGSGLRSAVAQVQFDGLQQAIYTAQEIVGRRFDAAVGGISFEGIDGEYLATTLYDGITGVAEAVQVVLDGQATRISGVIRRTLRSFTLDAAQATITDSVDIINRGATSVQLAFGRVEGALLRLSNNADGHITALIDEVDAAIARFTNWGAGSLRVGVESLRTGLLDVRNAGEGALLLWADTVEARETRISNLGAGALITRIERLRTDLLDIRSAGQGALLFWANEVRAKRADITSLDEGVLVVRINRLRTDLLNIRAAGESRILVWANEVKARRTQIAEIDAGSIATNINALREQLTNTRNVSQNKLADWRNRVNNQLENIRDIDAGNITSNANDLRARLLTTRNTAQNRLANWVNRVQDQINRITDLSNDLGGGNIAAELKKIVENRLPQRFKEALDRAFEGVFGATDNINFLAGMSSLVGANSALVTSLRSLAQTIRMSAEESESIRRAQVDTYAAGVRGSVTDALGAGVAPATRGGGNFEWGKPLPVPETTDHSVRQAPLEAALGEIAGHFQQMLGLSSLPNRTLKVGDGSPYFEQLTISGYGSIQTSKVNDMRRLASFMLESYADWALKGNRLPAEVQKILDGRNWSPNNVQNALANLAKSLGYAGHLPSFASGGYHAGGLAIVGEQGPELVDFASPSRIYSAPDTSRIMASFANDNGSFRELIAEVRALRAENAELRRTVSEGFGDTVQAEGQSGLALRAELRGLREDVEDLQSAIRQQERRRAS